MKGDGKRGDCGRKRFEVRWNKVEVNVEKVEL